MRTIVKSITLLFVGIFICFVLFLISIDWFWPESNGSYYLGNNIYMIEWDGGGRIIVQGKNIDGNTCYGGNYLIPTHENQYDSIGNFAEYVIDAKADDNWIIAKTGNKISLQRKYYILSKEFGPDATADDIINSWIESYTDSSDFAKKCLDNKIGIKW